MPLEPVGMSTSPRPLIAFAASPGTIAGAELLIDGGIIKHP